jgi:ribosomal protein S18 acetylase RimI-like enzyme
MAIRSATPDDVPALLPMVAAICAMHQRLDPERYPMLPDVVDRYERWLPLRAADARSVLLIACAPDATNPPIGFIVGTVEPNIPIYRLSEFGYIHDLWIEPPHRRAGHAGALIDAALDRFRAIGVTQVRLETAAPNDAARRLFASRGFRVGTIDMLRTL